jgi:hypothetical protein
MNNKMQNSIVSSLSIDYCNRKLIAGTYGRGIWESDLYEPTNIPTIVETITSNTVWNETYQFIEGSILVKSGNTLTIQGTANINNYTSTTTVNMPKNGVIYVEKGAKLIIDGAKITNGCDAQWFGIIAHGDPNLPQANNGTYFPNHGYVKIINNAIIEHAQDALHNGVDLINGGVIEANNAHFINNNRSAEFLQYNNMDGGFLHADASKLESCEFIVDDNLRGEFHGHITMWNVRGVKIKGCAFKNLQIPEKHHKKAIYTLDASYFVMNNGTEQCTFEGFNNAIQSTGYCFDEKHKLPIRIENAFFEKNGTGIWLKDILNPSVTGNNIKIGNIPSATCDYTPDYYFSKGARLENVSHFNYRSNIHDGLINNPPAGTTGLSPWIIGTEFHSTGDIDHFVRQNSYNNLTIGTGITGRCGSTEPNLSGICFNCNTNNLNSDYDYVLYNNGMIRYLQSASISPLYSAHNTFSQTGTCLDWVDNTGINTTNYIYYPGPNLEPNNINNVGIISTLGLDFDCSGIPPINNGFTNASELATAIALYNTIEAEHILIKNQYLDLINGGNTEATIEEINTSTTSTMMALRDEMLATSPYLTQAVLEELANSNVLTPALLLEVLMANPEATRSEAFLAKMQFQIANPLPEYMINMIRTSWNGATYRTALEGELATTHGKLSELRNKILYTYQENEYLYNETAIETWRAKLPSLKNAYVAIENKLNAKNYEEATNLLDYLPTNFTLNESSMADYTAYVNLFNFKKMCLQDSIAINKLDSLKLIALKNIADEPINTFARSMSRNLLCFFYNTCYNAENEMPISSTLRTTKSNDLQYNKETIVYPNPAKDFVVFYYKLNNKEEAKELIISDAIGKPIYTNNLNGINGQHIWDTKKVANGIYIYNLKTSTGRVISGQIVVKK